MATYLVEAYLANRPKAVEAARSMARRAADVGSGIRYLRTTFLPHDETVFHLFEAPSEDAVVAAATVVAMPIDRITEAVDGPDQGDQS
jgi:hypothetical protein